MTRTSYRQSLNYELDFETKFYYWQMTHTQEFLIPTPLGNLLESSEFEEDRAGLSFMLRQDIKKIGTHWSLETSYEQAGIEDNEQNRRHVSSGVNDRSHMVDYSDTDQDIIGLSLDAKTELASQWYAVWGGRYDHYDTFGSEFSPRVGFIYQPENTTALKLMYADCLLYTSPSPRD